MSRRASSDLLVEAGNCSPVRGWRQGSTDTSWHTSLKRPREQITDLVVSKRVESTMAAGHEVVHFKGLTTRQSEGTRWSGSRIWARLRHEMPPCEAQIRGLRLARPTATMKFPFPGLHGRIVAALVTRTWWPSQLPVSARSDLPSARLSCSVLVRFDGSHVSSEGLAVYAGHQRLRYCKWHSVLLSWQRSLGWTVLCLQAGTGRARSARMSSFGYYYYYYYYYYLLYDFNVYRSSTFGQASITKAGTSWKWEERSQGRFMDSRAGSQTSLSVLRSFLKVFFWNLVSDNSEFFCRAPWDSLRNFLACFLFSFLYGVFWPCTSEKLCFKISGFCQTIFIRVTKSNLFLGGNCNDKNQQDVSVV